MWQHAGSSGQPPPADAESAVRGLVKDFTTSFNTGNYDQCAALFVPEGQLFISHREATHGVKAIERMLRDLGDAGYQDLRLETLRVDAAGDRAIETGRYTVSIHLASGKVVVDRGNYLAYWRRLGAWRIAAHCLSSNLPTTWLDVLERQLRTVERSEVIAHDVQRPA